MAAPNELPEGTHALVEPGVTEPSAADISVEPANPGVKEAAREKVAGLTGQAADKAREYAAQGKDKAVSGLDSVTRLIDDAAATIDEKVGSQYGDYARKAAESVAGLSSTLRSREVDELLQDARAAIKKSPAIAIGAAVAAGFVLARLIKAGSAPEADDTPAAPAQKTRAPGKQSPTPDA